MKVIVKTRCDEPMEKKKRKYEDLTAPAKDIIYEPCGKTTKIKENAPKKTLNQGKSKYPEKAMNLFSNRFELLQECEDPQRKKLKTGKENLFNLLCQSDEEESSADLKEKSNTVQKVKHKRIGNVTPEQDQKIKQIYKDQNKTIKNCPFLELKEAGEEASLNINEEDRYPLIFPDIEEVLSHVQYNRHITRWMNVKRATKLQNTIMLSVEGPGLEDYLSQLEDCPTLQSYRVGVEFVSPLSYGDCIEHGYASKLDVKPPPEVNIKEDFQSIKSCPKNDGFIVGLDTLFNIKWKKDADEIPDFKEKSNEDKQDDIIYEEKESKIEKDICEAETPKKSDTCENLKNSSDLSETEAEETYKHCLKTKQALPISLYKRDNFSRLDLVLSPREMANEKYPLPFMPRFHTYLKTKDSYKEVTDKSPMFGLDCEMCETRAGSELTRISLVNEKHEVVYERLVKPHNNILNYLTKYSGITAKMLNPIKTRLSDVQRDLQKLLPPDAILVGQSLNCDLIAMKMMHPYVIDTSLIFNLSGVRKCKAKLKTLCAEFLSEKIQDSSRKGHNSIEDALGALKLVQEKLKHNLEWGDAVLGYKRSEEESRKANLNLRNKEKEHCDYKIKLRLALNAVVDDASLFEGPKHQHLITQNKERETEEEGSSQNKSGKSKRTSNLLLELYGDYGNIKISRKKNKKNGEDIVYHTENQVPNTAINYIYSEVAVIGSREVHKRYKAHLSDSARERVTFFKADSSKDVLSKILELDSLEDKKQLIIAHLKSPCVCQVEKWSAKLKSEAKENDFVTISLFGSKGSTSVRGAFFATLPTLDKLPPVKEVVQRYLVSCGYKFEDKQEENPDSTSQC